MRFIFALISVMALTGCMSFAALKAKFCSQEDGTKKAQQIEIIVPPPVVTPPAPIEAPAETMVVG